VADYERNQNSTQVEEQSTQTSDVLSNIDDCIGVTSKDFMFFTPLNIDAVEFDLVWIRGPRTWIEYI
jgi:hypothetical protein